MPGAAVPLPDLVRRLLRDAACAADEEFLVPLDALTPVCNPGSGARGPVLPRLRLRLFVFVRAAVVVGMTVSLRALTMAGLPLGGSARFVTRASPV